MKLAKRVSPVAGRLLGHEGPPAPVLAAGVVAGTIVHEAQPAVYEYVFHEDTGQTDTIVVSYPVYEPVMATVTAYGPAQGGGPATAVAHAVTHPDGSFSVSVPVDSVYLQVTPTSDWQAGWLWAEAMPDDPLFASYLQRTAPTTYDVASPRDVGLIQVQSALASGRVIDAATEAPIARARVTYEPVLRTAKLLSTTTDATGRYTLSGLDYEEYHIHVTAPRYVGGYLGGGNLLYRRDGDATTWATGPLHGDVIKMVRRGAGH